MAKRSLKGKKKPIGRPDRTQPVTGGFTQVWPSDGTEDSTVAFGMTGSESSLWQETSFTASTDTPRGTRINISKFKKEFDVKYIFKITKKKLSILQFKKLDTRIKALEKLITEYMELGQWTLAEENMMYLERIVRESEIYACGFTLFLEKDHLEKFRNISKDKRNLFLTPLKDFIREIPPAVQKKLKLAQENKLFDEYMILHYDPAMKGIPPAEKKKIEKKRKDPILFGVMKQSTRFYFIADWIDEYCDLTLEDIIDAVKIDEAGIVLTKTPDINDLLGKEREVPKTRTKK